MTLLCGMRSLAVFSLLGLCYAASAQAFGVTGARSQQQGAQDAGVQGAETDKQFQKQFERARRFLVEQKYARAAATAERLVERRPESVPAWRLLVECHLQPAWMLRNDSRCEAAAEALLQLVGRDPEVLRALAVAKFRQRRPEAIELITELVDAEPPLARGSDAADLLSMRARLHLEGAAPDSLALARADLERALAEDSTHSISLIERSALLLDDGQPETALADLLVALQRRAGDREVHFLLSRCYRGIRDMDKARHHREVSSLINRLIDSLGAASAPDLDERLQILARLRKINSKDGLRRVEYADLLMAQGQMDEAYQQVIEVQRDFPQWPAARALAARYARVLAGDSAEEDDDDGC